MNAPTDLAALKGRQQAAWASGDYAVIGTKLQIVGETLCETVDLRSGEPCWVSPTSGAPTNSLRSYEDNS